MIKWPTELKLNELVCSPNKSENNPRCHDKEDETRSPVQCRKISTCSANQQGSCSCGENITDENSSESKPHDKIPYTSRHHKKDPGTSDQRGRTPPHMSGPRENGALTSQTNPRRSAVNPVYRIHEEGLQSRHSSRLGPNAGERRPNRGHRQSENAVPGPSNGGYQPDFHDDSEDTRNWQEHSNSREKRSTGNKERGQRGSPPDLYSSIEANRTAHRRMPAGQLDGDRPTTRRRQQEHVPERDNSRLQHLQNRLQLLKRVEHIKRTLLADIQEQKQQPQLEELQLLRRHRTDNEKQKLSEMGQRSGTRQQLEQQDPEQQPFDDQVPSSQFRARNATAYRDPLPAPNRPATADQQPRRKLYDKPTATDTTLGSSRNPGAARQAASSSPQKRRVSYQPSSHSDSSSSAGECNRRIPAPPFANATTSPRRRAVSAEYPMPSNDYRQMENRKDNGVRTRPRSMDMAPATVPADSPGSDYDAVARNGNPRLVSQTLNFTCNCDDLD
ncbi:Hypothetical protein CINCED_3A022038 [Cinara cedri]|uniref:Uncharacterized protein n=1 Tax=Cinara cedri TaxID=506608 RepID=A0A5E4NR29_9HEMI|nr:Hypothetical protein CINCED_3A022038 [Cinara cedri]